MSDIQKDREERQHVIEVLKQMRLDYEDFWEENDTEEIKAFNYAIASIETDLRYDLLYEETIGQADKQADKTTTKNDLEIVMDAMEYRTNALIENIKSEIMHFANAHCSGDDISIYDVFKIIDDCCEDENSTTKNDLGVASGLEKNSKKLEKDFGELDCISRAEVLKLMQDNWHTHNGDWAMQESMDDIRALPAVTPQEPFINKPCVSSGVCEHDKNEVLDKIRAEILRISSYKRFGFESGSVKDGYLIAMVNVLDIIDKYKAESEE